MSNHKARIAKLETARGAGKAKKYLCVVGNFIGSPEEKAKGYKVQPLDGTGREPFYFQTRAELEAFEAREDVDLTILKVGYVDKKPEVNQELETSG